MGRLCIVSGDDDFAVRAKAKDLIRSLCGDDPESNPALEIIPGGGETKFPELASRVLTSLRTPPFLSDSQVIWIRGFAYFDELAAAVDAGGAAGETARLLCGPLPEEQSVVIDGAGLDGRRSFVRKAKAAGAEVFMLSAVRGTDRNFEANFRLRLKEICRRGGKSAAPEAVQYLEETIGGAPGVLEQELAKLFCYVGDAAVITLEDCRAVCSRTPEAAGWAFTAALTGRSVAEALAALDALKRQGEPELRVLAAASTEFQQLIMARGAMRELNLTGVNPRTFDRIPQETRDKFPDNMLLRLHPFRAYKLCERALSFGDEELGGALSALLDANLSLVSGRGDPRMVMERLVFRIAGGEPA